MPRASQFLTLLLALATASAASAIDIEVPADEPTIQAAIDAALDGDTIIVAPGTYAEIIEFHGKAITLRSSGGAAVTTIDATTVPDPGAGKPVVRMDDGEGPGTALEGFTITGGTGHTQVLADGEGGGLFAPGGSSPTVRDCVFVGNAANRGGGVYAANSDATFTDCAFIGNTAGNYAGAAVNAFGGGAMSFVRCRFEDNVTTASGTAAGAGALFADGTTVTVTDCAFTGNVGRNAGALFLVLADGSVLTRCTFIGNSAEDRGGAMWVQQTDATMIACRFVGNSAVNAAGAILVRSSASLRALNCEITGNTASHGGGIQLQSGCPMWLTHCALVANTAVNDGGGVHVESGSWNSGVVNGCIFWENADQGGAVATAQINFSGGNGLEMYDTLFQGGWFGPGFNNLNEDPLLADVDGADDALGTEDDDVRLTALSPCLDRADYAEYVDLNGPYDDLDGNPRVFDAPSSAFLGLIDIGPYEFGSTTPTIVGACCLGSVCVSIDEEACLAAGGSYDGDGTTCAADACPPACAADIDGDGAVGFDDLIQVLSTWGPCPP